MNERIKSVSSDNNGADRSPPGPDQPAIDMQARLAADIASAGGELETAPELEGAVGITMFDVPNSEDGTVTVLLAQNRIADAPSQALARIRSRDGKTYLGIVSAGPFAEPDSLRGDSSMLVTATARGSLYLPPYHGRVQVTLLGEELTDDTGEVSLGPPRLRPLPNSGVFILDDAESARVLCAEGDIDLGIVAGYDNVRVGVPSNDKQVLPRHTAILGTTSGGKSTTVARLVQQAEAAGMAVILLDVEGEYTALHEPTDDRRMLAGLLKRGLRPGGVPLDAMTVYRLVGRDTTNPDHPHAREFSLRFSRLSPYAAIEILGLNDAQTDRFLAAYDITKTMMRELGIFPDKTAPPDEYTQQERSIIEIDEFTRGYPNMTLALLIDVVGACLAVVNHQEIDPRDPRLSTDSAKESLKKHIAAQKPTIASSWGKLMSLLQRMRRLNVFDRARGEVIPLEYKRLIAPGEVSVFDLSDSGMSELSNLVIADLLRGVQEAQDTAYEEFEQKRRSQADAPPPGRVLVIVEEAHEFLSAERIEKMEVLFKQVATIAKRGRKRWMGLVFVTQLPQHLPRQVFGLVNSYILHKITDPQVVSTLQRTVSGIDTGLWQRLPGLAPGQAIVSFPHMTRPLLASIHPTPAKLKMID